jgi:hypothetical protein
MQNGDTNNTKDLLETNSSFNKKKPATLAGFFTFIPSVFIN